MSRGQEGKRVDGSKAVFHARQGLGGEYDSNGRLLDRAEAAERRADTLCALKTGHSMCSQGGLATRYRRIDHGGAREPTRSPGKHQVSSERGATMEKFIATIRGIVVVAVFLLLPLVPPVGVDEASAQSACQLAIDAALDACGAAEEAINGPIGSMDDLEEAHGS